MSESNCSVCRFKLAATVQAYTTVRVILAGRPRLRNPLVRRDTELAERKRLSRSLTTYQRFADMRRMGVA